MTISLTNIWNDRALEIQAGTDLLPDSIFIASPGDAQEFCIEIRRSDFLEEICKTFDLIPRDQAFDEVFSPRLSI